MRRQNKKLSQAWIELDRAQEISELRQAFLALETRLSLLYKHLDLEIKHQPAVTKLVKKKR